MGLSYFQKTYKLEDSELKEVENKNNVVLYDLPYILEQKVLTDYIKEKSNRDVHKISIELDEETGISKMYISPKDLLDDITAINRILPEFLSALTTGQDAKIKSGLEDAGIRDEKKIAKLKLELDGLETLANYSITNDYKIKFGVDF